MKWLILLFVLMSSLKSYSQVKFISSAKSDKKTEYKSSEVKDALTEFAKYANFEFRFGNGNFKAIMLYSIPKPTSEIYVMMETLIENPENNIIVLKTLWNACHQDKEQLFANLISIGLSAKNSQLLIDYISNDVTLPKKDNTKFFNGTRKFCEELNIWYYEVSINEDLVTIKCFPGEANSSYNSSKPVEVVKGKILDGQIVTNDPPEYLTNRYKYKNGIFYVVNSEDGYNEYYYCK